MIIRPHIMSLLPSVSKHTMWSYYDWVNYCYRPSVNTICGRIIIGLSTDGNNDNPILIRPHIVFTDGRQQRQLNHNLTTYCVYWRRQQRQPNHITTTYYVYWRITTTINPIIIRPHICRPSVNTICGHIIIGLSLSSVSKHNMWSYYDWVYCCCRPSVNTICGRNMIGLSLLSSVSKHNMWSY
jgi:hypothetical protein